MSKYKAGDIVAIKGTEFVVLDIEKGAAKDGKDKLFVLLKEPVGITEFGTTNDYGDSELRCAAGQSRLCGGRDKYVGKLDKRRNQTQTVSILRF